MPIPLNIPHKNPIAGALNMTMYHGIPAFEAMASPINDNIIIDTLDWKGNAKKSGLEMDDIISEIKIENFDRPNKDFIYIFAFIALILFGFLNYKNYRFSGKQY